tara:strand:+ start:354 stop:884 length:531 start_codon:yes stop_codon:yes gene_type:complete
MASSKETKMASSEETKEQGVDDLILILRYLQTQPATGDLQQRLEQEIINNTNTLSLSLFHQLKDILKRSFTEACFTSYENAFDNIIEHLQSLPSQMSARNVLNTIALHIAICFYQNDDVPYNIFDESNSDEDDNITLASILADDVTTQLYALWFSWNGADIPTEIQNHEQIAGYYM